MVCCEEITNLHRITLQYGPQESYAVSCYSLSAKSNLLDDLPEKTAKKLPGYPDVPAMRLGRLAGDMHHKGSGYGEVLLVGALRRSFQAATDVASYAVVVDSKDDQAYLFYEHYGFIRFPDYALRMFLPMQTIARLFV